ncbi:MAG: peptidase C14, partial [Symploca sp. SIO2D2]|nr:peptidase C14 [Symploca sp. SIO2D2]
MGRDALVVGINTYSYGGLGKLEAPARDAEAIAQQLEASPNPFRVERLPGIKDKANDSLKVGKKTPVSLRQLKKALVRYFKPRGETYADTVLFYYSGHGLYDDLTGKSYLATSDVNPDEEKWGFALRDLAELLRESPVKRQIIWLDCCHSGGLVAVKDANPGEQAGYSRCFVAASQEIESAYELASGDYGVLTEGLLQGLNPQRLPGQWIDTLSLCAFVNQYLKDVRQTYPQRALFLNVGEPIDLTRCPGNETAAEKLPELQPDNCPYRALNAFDFTPEDVEVFFGRRILTDELLGQIYQHHFLAVLGPSGSGKSSVVRAGLLYELQQGKRRSGTETWQILPIIKPGESPLRSLAGVFIPETFRFKKKGEALLNSSVAELREVGAAALVEMIEEEEYEQPVVLVVDQFEEIFTLCRGSEEKEQERKQFLNCLFGAVDALAGKLRLVITLRADFLGKCLEQSYGNLAERIKASQVDMTPLTDAELDEVICKPAETVGLQVAPYLQKRLKEHIQEAPGSLPLLEYALTELWRDWHTRYQAEGSTASNQLTFEGYDRIGGVAGALEKQANSVYESFASSSVKQGLVQRIFLELVQLGEETEDTRRRVLKQELISEIHPEEMVDEVLSKLVESRLVVTDETPTENDSSAVVIDLAHEATIRHWKQLRYWLNKHRQDLPLIRQLRKETATWQVNEQKSKYLLVGARLDAALDCLEKYRELGYLNKAVQTFIQVSYATWIEAETEKERQILEALCMTAEIQWNKNQQLESLISITKAGVRVQQLRNSHLEVKPDNCQKAVRKLRETLYRRIQEKNRLRGHSHEVKAIAYSPDSTTLASASLDKTVKLWNAQNGSLLATLQGHRGEINVIAYSPDGATLTSASDDKTVKLWNVQNGSLLTTLKGHSHSVKAIAYSPDGAILASASLDKTVKLWNPQDGSLLTTLKGHSHGVNAIAYSPDGAILASASLDNTVKLWNAQDGSLLTTLQGHANWVNAIAYSPDGTTLASASDDNTVKLWNAQNGSLLATLQGHRGEVKAIAYSPDGAILASASLDKTVKLWNVQNGSLLATLQGHRGEVKAIAYSPDGATLASASDDNTVKLWNAQNRSLLTTLQGHSHEVKAIAYSPDGATLASASLDKTVKLWSVQNSSPLTTLKSHSYLVKAIAYSPDGATLASASWDKTVKLWSAQNGSLLATLEGHSYYLVSAIAYSPDGTTLASASDDKTVKLWNAQNGSFLATLKGHSHRVKAIAYSPDSTTLVSASDDKTVKLWNPQDGSLLTTLKGHSHEVKAIAYSPDSTTLASASLDKTVKLWNAQNGSLLATLQGHRGEINVIAYSPDGATLTSASDDKTVKLWNVQNGSLLTTLKGHSHSVKAIAYSPDGAILASASLDKTVKLWNPQDGSLLTTLKGHSHGVNAIAYSPDGAILASAS